MDFESTLDFDAIERDVLKWINRARTEPSRIIGELTKLGLHLRGKIYTNPETLERTEIKEGISAVQEALKFLRDQRPLPALKHSASLQQAAREHAADVGTAGDLRHESENGDSLDDRISRHAVWQYAVAENLNVLDTTGKDVVLSFVLDDGNASRNQRQNLFNPE